MITTLLAALVAPTATGAAPSSPPAAIDFMIEAVRALCLTEGGRIESARRVVPAGWRLTDSEDHIDVQLGVEAVFPRHDTHERRWRGALANGRGTLHVEVTSYRDLARAPIFSAWIRVSPESAIDLGALQGRIGLRLRATGPAVEGREPSRRSQSSEENVVIVTSWEPAERQFGRMQSFALEPAPQGIEIGATRYWGAGYPEQSLQISCRASEQS